MSEELTCSACHHVLRVEGGSSSAWLTCPRCLARVVNPAALVRTDLPTAAPTCPACGRGVRSSWRLCPECGQPLGRSSRADEMDREATRDSSGARAVGIGLGVLLLFGVVLFFAQGGSSLLGQAGPEVLVFFFLLVGLMVGGVLTIVHSSKSPRASAVSGILGGLAFGVGGVLLGVLIFCLVVLAAFQNFIESCAKCGR